MREHLEVLAASATTFAATNIDDAFLLTLFFARRVPTRRIVLGQYLGFALIVGASLIGASAALILPHRWIRYLGLLPLAIGARHLLRARSGIERRLGDHLGIGAIALLTFSNGADNIGVYIPFFVVARQQIWLILSVYAALVAVWCLVARKLGSHPLVLRALDRWGHWIVPLVFVGLGIYVLRS